ncbi:MAG: hypothetical protein AAF224_11805 [Pseudomonadota bacterium]
MPAPEPIEDLAPIGARRSEPSDANENEVSASQKSGDAKSKVRAAAKDALAEKNADNDPEDGDDDMFDAPRSASRADKKGKKNGDRPRDSKGRFVRNKDDEEESGDRPAHSSRRERAARDDARDDVRSNARSYERSDERNEEFDDRDRAKSASRNASRRSYRDDLAPESDWDDDDDVLFAKPVRKRQRDEDNDDEDHVDEETGGGRYRARGGRKRVASDDRARDDAEPLERSERAGTRDGKLRETVVDADFEDIGPPLKRDARERDDGYEDDFDDDDRGARRFGRGRYDEDDADFELDRADRADRYKADPYDDRYDDGRARKDGGVRSFKEDYDDAPAERPHRDGARLREERRRATALMRLDDLDPIAERVFNDEFFTALRVQPKELEKAIRKARRKAEAREKNRMTPWKAIGWSVWASAVVALVFVSYAYRDNVVAMFPNAARAYSAVGIDAAPFGLKIENVRHRVAMSTNGPTIEISGRLVNAGRKAVVPPILQAEALGADGGLLSRWTFEARADMIDADGAVEFNTRAPAPDGVVEVALTFVPVGSVKVPVGSAFADTISSQ